MNDINTILAKLLEFISKILEQLIPILKNIFNAKLLADIWYLIKLIFTYLIKFLIVIFDFLLNLLKNILS